MLALVAAASASGAGQRSSKAAPPLLGIEDNAQILGNSAAVQHFAYAAAARYNGRHVDAGGATLPKVVRWEACRTCRRT